MSFKIEYTSLEKSHSLISPTTILCLKITELKKKMFHFLYYKLNFFHEVIDALHSSSQDDGSYLAMPISSPINRQLIVLGYMVAVMSHLWSDLLLFLRSLKKYPFSLQTLNCIWRWGSSSGEQRSVEYPFIASLLWAGVAVPVRISSMGQIDLFQNDLYSIGLRAKEKPLKQLHKKCKYKHMLNNRLAVSIIWELA